MSTSKKSFILYLDQKELFEKLPDETAGKLIKHIFRYVNCENPEEDDLIVDVAFASIKQALKRDLKKWETQTEQRRQAGLKSAEKRANEKQRKSTSVKTRSTNSTDSVSDSDSDSVSEVIDIVAKAPAFNFKSELLSLGVDNQVLEDWLTVRKKKKASNTKTALKSLLTEINKSGLTVKDAIEYAAKESWSGFKAQWYFNNQDNRKESVIEKSANSDWHLQDQGF